MKKRAGSPALPGKIRIAVVDTSPEIHAAIASLMEGESGVEIVRRACSLGEFADLTDRSVNVVVAELRTCIGEDRGALEALRERCPKVRLIITTSNEGREYEDAARRLDADGWVPKTRLAHDLLMTLRRIA